VAVAGDAHVALGVALRDLAGLLGAQGGVGGLGLVPVGQGLGRQVVGRVRMRGDVAEADGHEAVDDAAIVLFRQQEGDLPLFRLAGIGVGRGIALAQHQDVADLELAVVAADLEALLARADGGEVLGPGLQFVAVHGLETFLGNGEGGGSGGRTLAQG